MLITVKDYSIMTPEAKKAIDKLLEAKSVEEWNKIRDEVKHLFSQYELAKIDSGGTIFKSKISSNSNITKPN